MPNNTNQISIEVVAEENDLYSLKDDWRRLFRASEAAPFLSFEWISTWYKWFAEDTDSPAILKVFRGGKLIGLVPFYRSEKKIGGLRLRKYGLLGDAAGGADYLDAIAEPADKALVFEAVIAFLQKENDFDVIGMESLDQDSEAVAIAEDSAANFKLKCTIETTNSCPQIELAEGWTKILKNSRRSSNFKRRLKKLQKFDDFEFRSVSDAAEMEEAFERFFYLHEMRWKSDGGSELSGHPRLASFQRELVRELAGTDLLRFDEIWVEGECRASVYGFDDGRKFYYYNAGYDLDWSNYSVGLVLIGLSVRAACERGNKVYDFLRGDENYKFDWANGHTNLVTVRLRRNNLPALMSEISEKTERGARKFIKNNFSGKFAEKLKAFSRRRKRANSLSAINTADRGEVL